VLRTVPGLEQRGWRFVFWASRPSALYDELSARDLDVHGLPRQLAYSLQGLRHPPGPASRLASVPSYLRGLRATIRRASPAIVHANSLYTLAEAAVARAAGRPTVLHVHEMLPAGRKGWMARRLAHAVSDELIAVSRASAAALALPGSEPRIVYEGAPLPAEPRSRDGGSERMIVGTVGVISSRKGSDLFVEAARLVGARTDQIEFRMIGAPTDVLEQDWAQDVLEHAQQVGIVHRLRADVVAELRCWDAFVLPSRRDPFPISLLEAMGTGLPVIGTAVDGIREQITPETGILVDPESPQGLANAILELQRSPDSRRRMGLAARRRMSDHFTVERQTEGIHDAYLAALRARGRYHLTLPTTRRP